MISSGLSFNKTNFCREKGTSVTRIAFVADGDVRAEQWTHFILDRGTGYLTVFSLVSLSPSKQIL
jgi:hypothetical protein